jgi:CRP-like cAMP-binding protein
VDDLRGLKDEARDASARGKHRKAAELYGKIAARERDPAWLLRAGEAWLREGERVEAVRRLGQAAVAFGKQGSLLKAIATCTRILEIEPNHDATQQMLATLHAKHDQPRAPSLPSTFPPPPPVPSDAPLPAAAAEAIDDEALSSSMPGARRSSRFPATAIPLDEEPATAEALLPRTPLFSSLKEPQLARLIGRVTRVDAQPGDVIVRQDEPASVLFVIARGTVRVTARVDGEEHDLGELGEGEFFGELGVMTRSSRMATVTASSEAQLLSIDRATIVELFREDAGVRRVLLRFFRDRLIARLVSTSPLFSALPVDRARAVADRFQLLEFERGAELVAEGAEATALFVLLCGRCEIRRGGAAPDEIGPGDVCGDVSLVKALSATATVAATTRVWALSLTRETLEELALEHPSIAERIQAIAVRRLRSAAVRGV